MITYIQIVRLLQLIVLFTAGILVVVGHGVCTFSLGVSSQAEPAECHPYRYSMNMWHQGGGWLIGQYFAIIIHAIMLLCVYKNFRQRSIGKDDKSNCCFATEIIVSILLGSYEAFMAANGHGYERKIYRERVHIVPCEWNNPWYPCTTIAAEVTYDKNAYSYVESWVAASILYYVFVILNLMDCCVTDDVEGQQQSDTAAVKKSVYDGSSNKVTIWMPDQSAEPLLKKENVTITMAAEPLVKKVQNESGNDSIKLMSGGSGKKITIKTADQSAKQNRIDSGDLKNVSIKSEGSSKKVVAKADQIVVPLLKQSV